MAERGDGLSARMARLAGRGGRRAAAGEVDASGEPSPERIRQAGPTSNTARAGGTG
jgi:hypothetical protein